MSSELLKFSRRHFIKLASGGAAGLAAFGAFKYWARSSKYWTPEPVYNFGGDLLGANAKVGHLLRDSLHLKPNSTEQIDTLIVGGGIAGLSAAWWLKKHGYTNFRLLEMDKEFGGNSKSGGNQISKYPWGAHYVPLPGPEAVYVREFFHEIGVIQSFDGDEPIYDPSALCLEPQERLLIEGQWQPELFPRKDVTPTDLSHAKAFFNFVRALANEKGNDGRRFFVIPLELSSQDPRFMSLDKISMQDFLNSNQWHSKALHWYIDYCCRDDFGVPHSRVSAWAGLHYFSSRHGTGENAKGLSDVTWPEGNGYLVNRLKELIGEHAQSQSLVYHIENVDSGCQVDMLDVNTQKTTRFQTKNVIYCGPRFTAHHVVKGLKEQSDKQLDFAPWLVANISLDQAPAGPGAPLAWDNVSFDSPGLGYVVATHKRPKTADQATVITYYCALDDKPPIEARREAYQKSYKDWLKFLLPDLESMHPGITDHITHLDVWIWGHGMVAPGVDYLWSPKRQEMLKPFGNVHFAHSDMSGMSLFEEAQYRGVEAAKKILGEI